MGRKLGSYEPVRYVVGKEREKELTWIVPSKGGPSSSGSDNFIERKKKNEREKKVFEWGIFLSLSDGGGGNANIRLAPQSERKKLQLEAIWLETGDG